MTHRAEDGTSSAEEDLLLSGESVYHEALPVWDKDADDGPPPTAEPDGSAWEPEDAGDEWEDKFIADPEAAAEATKERMDAQFEQEKAEAGVPEDPPPA